MATGKQARCPSCGKIADVATFKYSGTAENFVCPTCWSANTASNDPSAKPAATAKAAVHQSKIAVGASLVLAALCITLIAILLTRNTGVSALKDDQRAWDHSNHDKIIALKSAAESLALEDKLPEAHAKYREIEKIIGGRQVKDPSLFDMVEVARQDQDNIYKILLSRMDRPAVQEAPAPSSDAPTPATTPATTPSAIAATIPSAATPPSASSQTTATATSVPSDVTTTPPIAQFVGIPRSLLTDEQVGEAIQRAVDFLISNFRDGEVRIEGMNDVQRQGINALCVYALASSSKAIVDQRLGPKSPEMILMLEKLKAYPMDPGGGMRMPETYARSLRACTLATFNRPQDREVLKDDVGWLINAATDGAYTYDDRFAPVRNKPAKKKPPGTPPAPKAANGPRAAMSDGELVVPTTPDAAGAGVILTDGIFTPRPPPPPPSVNPVRQLPSKIFTNTLPRGGTAPPDDKYKSPFPWDNSNSQYGLLGVWAGAEVGIEVPEQYWRAVERHWSSCQLPSGEWNYSGQGENGRFSMTCAGIASLLVTNDFLNAPALGGRSGTSRQPYSAALSAGLAWLEDEDHSIQIAGQPLHYVGYNLFGIERVGLASGFKQFGAYDWFFELAHTTLKTQWPNGAFGQKDEGEDALINTAYVLLFLSRGRHPIMVNKLHYDGAWTNRPREIANLANYASKELERPLNWQVVDIVREPTDWAESPILFIAGNKAVQFTPEDMSKLQTFVDNGGILFTHSDLSSPDFNRFAADLAKQLFPAYPMADLPVEHPLYKLNYTLPLPRPRLQGVSNGVRLLMVHSPTDLSAAWQTRATVSRKELFQLGTNLYLYATGKEKFRNRLDTPLIPQPTEAPLRTIEMARLHYQGNWDPEPGAWSRMARVMEWETGAKLNITPVDMDELTIDKFRIAHLTGTDTYEPNAKDLASLKQFVEAGGTLLIDAAGGSGAFADAENSWLPKLLAGSKLEAVGAGDPLLKQTIDGTVDVPTKALRLYAMEQLTADGGRIKVAKVGKGRIVFSAMDITSGLLGMNTWGILGYLPEYCEAVVKNLALTAETK